MICQAAADSVADGQIVADDKCVGHLHYSDRRGLGLGLGLVSGLARSAMGCSDAWSSIGAAVTGVRGRSTGTCGPCGAVVHTPSGELAPGGGTRSSCGWWSCWYPPSLSPVTLPIARSARGAEYWRVR